MKVLILGSGGREHALAWKISQSKLLTELYIGPGNGGTDSCGKNVDLKPEDFESVARFVLESGIDLVVVGPEAPLVSGIRDYFESKPELKNVLIIGPGKVGAQLEGSKDFAKEFMIRHNIPTAPYRSFTRETVEDAVEYLQSIQAPYVLKADGLAAGKGVLILNRLEEAEREIRAMLSEAKFGAASEKVVIEGFLDGIELSVFVLTDGENYVLLPTAKDYKRIGENDTGLNTGGMGAVSPVPFINQTLMEKIESGIVEPTVKGLAKEGIPYKGFIFFGLINVDGDPFVIEYNVRMGDPETEVVLPRVEDDLLEILVRTAKGELSKNEKLKLSDEYTTTVMLVSGGYPEGYEKGKVISGLDEVSDALLFHAGTVRKDADLVTSGGRVIALTGKGENLSSALNKSYEAAGRVQFEGKYYRKDIGKDLGKFI